MTITILRLASLLYAVAAGAYVYAFVRPGRPRAASLGQGLLVAAFVVHAISIGAGCAEYGGSEFFNLRGGLGMAGWLLAGGLLLLLRVTHLPSVAAFVLPLVLAALVPGVVGSIGGRAGVLPEVVRQPATRVHVPIALTGVALFAIASVVGLMYLLQEREVKGKHFGALFSRLPNLSALDRMNQRLGRAGFAIWSLTVVTGMFLAKKSWGKAWSWDPQQVGALVVWGLSFAMVWLRHQGVHGRRYAVLTLVGFVLVVGSLLAFQIVPGLTRHGGTFQ
jgi:ABC-type transport system involved in cytochrome c biogenesis permease subunit